MRLRSYCKKFLLLLLLCLAGCQTTEEKLDKPLVLVSIEPYRYFVEQIAGNTVEINTIVPAGANAHTFEPTPRQINRTHLASVWFRIGEPFESTILPVLQRKNPHLIVVDMRHYVDLIPYDSECLDCHHHDELDRHIWLNTDYAKIQAKEVARILTSRFPEHEELYKKNLEKFLAELQSLDSEIRSILSPMHKRFVLVSHPALGYFCKEYNCEQISVEFEGRDPLPKYLEKILNEIKEKDVNVVIVFPQHNNKGAELIAKKLSLPVKLIDPYSYQYMQTMRTLAFIVKGDESANSH